MPLRDYIRFNSGFSSSVNLYLDLNKTEKIKAYIPAKSSVDILDEYLDSVLENRQQSTLLIGPYGKGKSHLLLMLLEILTVPRNDENSKIIDELSSKVSKVSRETAEKINRGYGMGRFLPVIISTTQEDLNQAFLIGMNETLKRENLEDLTPETYFTYAIDMIQKWENEFPDTYGRFCALLSESGTGAENIVSGLKNCDTRALDIFRKIYPELTSGAEFNPLAASEVLPLYKNIADKLVDEFGYSGIYIVFDEFSKYIESLDRKSSGSSMKLLQDMCELANSSKDAKIFLTMVAHKSIKEYGRYLSAATINSFTGIEGRIKEVLFVTSSKNNYELIRNAINKDENCFKEPGISKFVSEETVSDNYRLPAFAEFTREDFENIVVRGCYPLSPTGAYLLLNISEKVAQNERTLFTFISKEEQYSMARTIKENPRKLLISADLIYDYFKGLFKKEVENELIHTEWLNAEYAIEKAGGPDKVRMLKTLAIINIVNKPDEIPADDFSLQLASGLSNASEVLEDLCERNLIYKKASNNCYVFKTRATSAIKNEIQRRKSMKGGHVNFNSAFADVSEVKYVLPKKYNMEYRMTRFFRYEFMSVEEFLSILDLNAIVKGGAMCDGKVLALYSTEEKDFSSDIEEKLRQDNCGQIIVLYGMLPNRLESVVREYEIVQELATDRDFFSNDENRVMVKELPIIEEDLALSISSYLSACFESTNGHMVLYCYRNELCKDAKVRLSDAADRICHDVYPNTLAVNNELINKESNLTAPIKKARKTIIEKMITGDKMDGYMQGTSAEATIYRAMFVGTGVTDENPPENTKYVMDIFYRFIDSACDNKASMTKLMDALTVPPVGMRRSIIPVYLAYALSRRNEDIVIYFDQKEVDLSGDIIINMCDTPEDYSIFISQEDAMKEQYLTSLTGLFYAETPTLKSESRLHSVLVSMQRWFRSLPQITKNIVRQEKYFGDDSLSRAFPKFKGMMRRVEANPYEILFVDMPAAFEMENDYMLLYEKISTMKKKLSGYYDYVTQLAVSRTIEVFGKAGKNDLNHTMAEWYAKQSDLAKQGLYSKPVTKLMSVISANRTFDDSELVKKMIYAVTGIYLDTWNESSMDSYIEQLCSVKDEIERIGDESTNTDKLELSFIGKSGNKITRYYEPVGEGKGATLRNILADTLEDQFDLSVNDKIAILLEMIEDELKQG